MDLNAGSAAFRVRQAEEEISRERKARAVANREPGALFGWGLEKLLRALLVYLPIGAGVAWLLWALVSSL